MYGPRRDSFQPSRTALISYRLRLPALHLPRIEVITLARLHIVPHGLQTLQMPVIAVRFTLEDGPLIGVWAAYLDQLAAPDAAVRLPGGLHIALAEEGVVTQSSAHPMTGESFERPRPEDRRR